MPKRGGSQRRDSWSVILEHRLVGLVILHALVFASIYWLCYVIRFDGAIPPAHLQVVLTTLPLIVFLKMVMFLATGSHRGLWRRFRLPT